MNPERVTNAFRIRHTHAVLMLQANIHPKVVAERLAALAEVEALVAQALGQGAVPGMQADAAGGG